MNGFHKMVLFLVVQSFFWIRANVLTFLKEREKRDWERERVVANAQKRKGG